MTAEDKCRVIKDIYEWAQNAIPGTSLYIQERMYFVKNNSGEILLVKASSEANAFEIANRMEWKSCATPPPDGRNVFLAHGTEKFKSCCIGHYDNDMKLWYEDKNWFASPIYDCKYWCDIPDLPDMGERQFSMPEGKQ